MAYTGPGNALSYGDYGSLRSEARESGYKRKKLAGLLKAANEVRQSYFSGEGGLARDGDAIDADAPGAFSDAAVVRSGNEEMILFPSYARKHVKSKSDNMPGKTESEQEYWRREWDKHANDNAVVNVEVRGWIYTPHRGQNTRKQRLFIGLARQLAGIPAPPATKSSESLASSQNPSRASSPTRLTRQEEDLINLEAETIVKRGQAEVRNAQRGIYSEAPSRAVDTDSLYGGDSAEASPERGSRLSRASTTSSGDDDFPITPLQKRGSWAQPSKMSAAELAVANTHLLNRLKPFMHMPLINSPITAFFYSSTASRQLTVYTNATGHFHCRAALEFVPTHVRILAGENLSATEEITITSPRGVSLISDIDDTVKHSAISAGFTEIFRNAFIRDLGDLTIEGVREWYNTLSDMGVKIHYVSNSPWQMYPVISSYFKMARLPRGSFHLKQYTGMLNGIFEPVAERKKSSLDKIMRDFPERKFILIGDSGEADLEVYTEVALDYPGRVLGIFIRDVTTSVKTGYFDPSVAPSGTSRHSRNHSRHRSSDSLAMSKKLSRPGDIRDDNEDLEAAIAASLADLEEETRRARRSINPDRPTLETFGSMANHAFAPESSRRPWSGTGKTEPGPEARRTASPEEDLIDFSDEPTPNKPWLQPNAKNTKPSAFNINSIAASQRLSPSPPPKPQALRSPSPNSQITPTQDSAFKPPPPRPRKPSSAVKPPSLNLVQQTESALTSPPHQSTLPSQLQPHQRSPLSQVTRQDSQAGSHARPPLPTRPRTMMKIANAAGSYWHGQGAATQAKPPTQLNTYADTPRTMSTVSTKSMDELRSSDGPTPRATAPPPPPRRNVSSYPKRASNRLSGSWDLDSPAGSPGEAGISTKERLWKQRWAKAQALLEPKGVTLRTWRVGSDVADVAVKLTEMELRRIQREERAR